MRKITFVLSCISVLITALPILRSSIWWVRIFDYPRLQIAVLCLISVALIIIFLKNGIKKVVILLLVLLAFAYQLFYILPYAPFSALQAENYEGKKSASSFSILEANIKMDNRKAQEFLELVEKVNPDIIVITEPDKWWENKLKSLDDRYRYSIKEPRGNTYGMILYSRLKLEKEKVNYLVDKNIPSFYTKVILPDKQEFDLYTLHPKPPRPGTSTYKQDTEILLVGRKIRKAKRPAFVAGDLNDVGWSYTSQLFQQYSRMLDPRRGRGLFNTYNVFIPLFRYPLDHFFYSKHFGFIRLERLKAIGSDHYPMVIEVNLKSNKEFKNDLPKADQDDKDEVNETIGDQ